MQTQSNIRDLELANILLTMTIRLETNFIYYVNCLTQYCYTSDDDLTDTIFWHNLYSVKTQWHDDDDLTMWDNPNGKFRLWGQILRQCRGNRRPTHLVIKGSPSNDKKEIINVYGQVECTALMVFAMLDSPVRWEFKRLQEIFFPTLLHICVTSKKGTAEGF